MNKSKLDKQRSAIDWTAVLRQARSRFGIKTWRPGQRELLEAVLTGRDALGILPTGAGKSLTYQLPALLLKGPVVVVSPLIALMQDQQEKLADHEISAAKLNSTLTATEERAVVQEIQAGEHPLIYVTPERLENAEYLDLLKRQNVSLFVVDEAHCVSQWGHDFRPAYLTLRDAIRELGRPPILALTATATPDVIDDIAKQLSMRDVVHVQTGIERKNLVFEVFRTPSLEAKQARLSALLGSSRGAGIVYAATVRVVDELFEELTRQGLPVGRYHGKMKLSERETTQQRFMNDELCAMIATQAFGLGVDKPNIRLIVHYNFPDSLESYYQEAGRAGRDGAPARISLLYKLEDKRVQSYFLGGKYPRREESMRVLEALQARAQAEPPAADVTISELIKLADVSERRGRVIIAQLEAAAIVSRKRGRVRLERTFSDETELAAVLSEYEQRHQDDHARLESMMHYAQTGLCRVRFLREYFGDASDVDCGICDNCEAHARGESVSGLEPRPALS